MPSHLLPDNVVEVVVIVVDESDVVEVDVEVVVVEEVDVGVDVVVGEVIVEDDPKMKFLAFSAEYST